MKSGSRSIDRSANRGYALVAVLWTLALLSLMAAALITHSRAAARIEKNAWDRLRVETIAEAATNRAILEILNPAGGAAQRFNGAPMSFDFEGTKVEISIQDELGKVDLNAASADRLRALLNAAGFSATDVDTLSERIMQWREPNDGRRTRRVSIEDYKKAGLPYEPRGAPFQSVDELRLVLGVTDAVFEKLRPAITVYSQVGAVDPQVAPELVLRANPGLSASAVREIPSKRSDSLELNKPDKGAGKKNASRIPLNGRAFTISVEVPTSKAPFHLETTIRLTGDISQPYWVLEKRTYGLAAPSRRLP